LTRPLARGDPIPTHGATSVKHAARLRALLTRPLARGDPIPTHGATSVKHAAGIFAKLDLAPCEDDNRRVLAVVAYLES